MKRKRSILLLLSWVLGLIYVVYLVSYFGTGLAGSESGAEAIGTGLAAAVVMPHFILVAVAVIFNILGWAGRMRWAALTGAILYAVSMAFMPLYAMFVVVEMVLSFIGFAKMPKKPAQVQIIQEAGEKSE